MMDLEVIQNLVYEIRGQRVMLDSDLAMLYQVETRRLNEQVRRNIERFPSDFMFQLTEFEMKNLMSQIATLNTGRGSNIKYLPFAFTEQGAVNDLSEDTRREIIGIWEAITAMSAPPKKDEKPRNPIGYNTAAAAATQK